MTIRRKKIGDQDNDGTLIPTTDDRTGRHIANKINQLLPADLFRECVFINNENYCDLLENLHDGDVVIGIDNNVGTSVASMAQWKTDCPRTHDKTFTVALHRLNVKHRGAAPTPSALARAQQHKIVYLPRRCQLVAARLLKQMNIAIIKLDKHGDIINSGSKQKASRWRADLPDNKNIVFAMGNAYFNKSTKNNKAMSGFSSPLTFFKKAFENFENVMYFLFNSDVLFIN